MIKNILFYEYIQHSNQRKNHFIYIYYIFCIKHMYYIQILLMNPK